jgi:Ca2+-transporting ATPase
VKSAAHRVLARCARIATIDDEHSLTDEWRARIEEHATSMASQGLRVLALADGPVRDTTERSLHQLTFVGLVGITDPPAAGVPETISILRGAGIRTIMLTGDHIGTALAIARQVGVASEADEALDGATIDRLSDAELDTRVRQLGVVSRVSPEGKLRVIAALQRGGEIVAMLGDGINDAAALKKSDIGVAMGRRGTDAAKEVADIVLEDDRFPTIAAAVEEGRVVISNIRKFVFYLFTCNVAEILVLLVAGGAGLPLPMTPMQVLWLNLVTDTFPALALAIEPGEKDVLRAPPRDPRAPLLSRGTMGRGLIYTLLIAGVTMIALLWGLARFPETSAPAVTLSFTTLALAQIFHLGNARSIGPVTSLRRLLANRYALAALGLTIFLQLLAVMLVPLGRILGTVRLGAAEWAMAFGLAAVPAIVGQAWKVFAARRVSGYMSF